MIQIYENIDCMEGMQKYEEILNKHKVLCISDPPYGINFGEFNRTNKDRYGNRKKADKYKNSDWDSEIPNLDYFNKVFKNTKNQIFWGGNYFLDILGSCKEFVFWHKHQPVSNFSDGEFAWTSFNGVAKCFDYMYYGNINAEPDRIHPTQKPVSLYRWLIKNYLKDHTLILDTHVGSASSLIAYEEAGLNYIGFELDKDYYKQSKERLKKARFEREAKKQINA